MTRTTRFLAAWLALFAMLSSQLALASYACPFLGAPVEMTAPMEGGCDGMPMDRDQPALCHAHGLQGDQSLDKPPVFARLERQSAARLAEAYLGLDPADPVLQASRRGRHSGDEEARGHGGRGDE